MYALRPFDSAPRLREPGTDMDNLPVEAYRFQRGFLLVVAKVRRGVF